MSYILKTWAVIHKDAKSELRARYAINSILLFCLTCVFIVSFSLKGTVQDPRITSALLWVILFFSAMTGLSRTFIKEEDQGTMNTLRLACEPGPLFLGKVLLNFVIMAATIVMATPLFALLMNIRIEHVAFFGFAVLPAALGMSAVCTLLSGLVAGARGRGMLFPVLAFPVLLPVFWVAVDATEKAFSEAQPWGYSNLIVFLACYMVVAFIGGSFLFEYIFRE